MGMTLLVMREPGSGSYLKCISVKKLSGNEVYYTICFILLVKIMLCSKLYCQIVFELKHILYKISGAWQLLPRIYAIRARARLRVVSE